MAKENQRVSFQQVKNGWTVSHSWDETKGKEMKFESETFVFNTAKETQVKVKELQNEIVKEIK